MSMISPFKHVTPKEFESHWVSPANIAFVKYWGKKGHQIPANPSLSLTLKECVTDSKIYFSPSDKLDVQLFLDGEKKEDFSSKIKTYLEFLSHEMSWPKNFSIKVETKNTFPHGAGIASSASGYSALALALTDYLYHCLDMQEDQDFKARASFLSRLASGSACRSIYPGFVAWGESAVSCDDYANPVTQVHHSLKNLQDTVLVISEEEKDVSSTKGHAKMSHHVFAEARFEQARSHFYETLKALETGDIEKLGKISESEALSLHAMMMTSPEAFTLLRPNSLAAIEMIWDFRKQTNYPLFFTLDAGPNLHLIYPDSYRVKILPFIQHELSPLAKNIIFDERGEGPVRVK